MRPTTKLWMAFFFAVLMCATPASAQKTNAVPPTGKTRILPQAQLAKANFGNDAPWYERNIPFFECSDKQIEEIYYYRWKLYKAHLKDLGDRGYLITEFLDDVGWSLKPWESLNDATAYHIREGRWLKDGRYTRETIDFMYSGGNDRHFSEAIADAAYADYLVRGDKKAALKNLPAMKRIFRAWGDHFIAEKGLYFIEPLLDATEYTISSIDATNGKDGFTGGDAFRPTINSFQFANARAISALSLIAGDQASAREYAAEAEALRAATQTQLWNDALTHFTDRYKVSNAFVHYGEFIRGRELAGYTPWYFELPTKDPKYVLSWKHALSPDELGGGFGLRTVEPSYEYYKTQYRYASENGVRKPECQWNGPSWPFQTTLVLGGLANVLNDYPAQTVVTAKDYFALLRQYTRQHYLNGQPDLQEDYDPDTGRVIVGLPRSHHYNHSGYNDLIITGLVGLRPRQGDVLEVNPLIPPGKLSGKTVPYFCLENVRYHGRTVTILYDRDGTHYKRGKGLSLFANGRLISGPAPLRKTLVELLKATPSALALPPAANQAVNVARFGFPAPIASTPDNPQARYAAIDGRVWFFPNVPNYWTNRGSSNKTDWFGVDFGEPATLDHAALYFYGDATTFAAPAQITLQYWSGSDWADVKSGAPVKPVENGETIIRFAPLRTAKLRAIFANTPQKAVALVEMKAYGDKTVAPRPLPDGVNGQTGLPETLSGLEQQNSRTGIFNGMRWRDAASGGFFAFDLPIAAGGPNALVVTYWGGETGNRRFDISIDGVKIAEQTLLSNRPGVFFEQTYAIPEALTTGKQTVKVRFQAHLGAIAGGVFGARLSRP